MLQKYQQSVIGGQRAGGRGGLPWGAPAGAADDAGYDECETPVILSARLEAVGILLKKVSARARGGLDEGAVLVGDDDDRERECWALLLGARDAYVTWAAVGRDEEMKQRRRQQQQQQEEEEEEEEGGGADGLLGAAGAAMEAFEGVLTFEVSR